jgi:hypothetical protein
MFGRNRSVVVSALFALVCGGVIGYLGVTVPSVTVTTASDTFQAVTAEGSESYLPKQYPLLNANLIVQNSDYVTKAELNARMTGMLYHTRWLMAQQAVGSGDTAVRTVEPVVSVGEETIVQQVARLERQIFSFMDEASDDLSDLSDDIMDDISDGLDLDAASLTAPSITNGILNGVTYSVGSFGVGTSSPSDLLAVAGPIYLADTTPSSGANRLYNSGGDLYWNGSLVTSSSTGSWASSGGDVFRLFGSVGIGTSTPSETLTVSGTLSAGTTTARIQDTGGQVCNVDAYGAVGDNSTDNYDAIMTAINACPEGGVVFFPMGEYRISQTIVLDKPVTLRGSYSPRWSYSSTPRSSIRADFGSFTGVAIIHVRDRSISGQAEHNNGGRIENLSLDGGSAGTDVTGIYFEGLVRDWKLTDVDISQTTGNGFEAAVGMGSGNPRGFTIRGLSIYSADGHGFRATALNDTYIDDLLAVGNSLRGIYLSSMGETKIANSRAVFNGLTGLYVDGSTNNGGLTFTDFSTDRNDRHGVRIAASGTSTITFNGLLTRRDGPNTSGGSETPYAGVAIIGSTTEKTAPIFITGLSQTVGIDDQGNPPLAPSVGVRVTNATYVKIDGQLWGVDDAYVDGGGNSNFIIEDDSVLKIGTAGAQELYTNNRKWVATSTGLLYNKSVSIGSTTGTRLLNIIAPSQAGARFQDTTNNVIFDMRAEDFQGFFGTFSNHQLRFQTNNTSRLTIGTNGFVGIGTTSPTANLHASGTVRFEGLGSGDVSSDANGNLTVSSDERLKNIESLFTAGLDEVLKLEPIEYHWNELSGMDMETLYAGFSAQNVQESIPEAVGEDKRGFLTLSDRPILAAVVNAIKEVWKTVTGNQERIERLESRVNELEAALQIDSATEKSTNEQDDEFVPAAPAEEVEEERVMDGAEKTELVDNTPSEGLEDATEVAADKEAMSTKDTEEASKEAKSEVNGEQGGVEGREKVESVAAGGASGELDDEEALQDEVTEAEPSAALPPPAVAPDPLPEEPAE